MIPLWLSNKRKRTWTFPMLQDLVTIGLMFLFSIHHLESLTFTICQWKSQKREVSLMLKSTKTVILTPIELSNDLDTFLFNPLVLLSLGTPGYWQTWAIQAQESLSNATAIVSLHSPVMRRQKGKETSGCVLGENSAHCCPLRLYNSLCCHFEMLNLTSD